MSEFRTSQYFQGLTVSKRNNLHPQQNAFCCPKISFSLFRLVHAVDAALGFQTLRDALAAENIVDFSDADDIISCLLHRVEHLYPGVPRLNVHTLEPHKPFRVGDIDVLPLRVMHGKMPIMAYRFGSLAYITDMKTISDEDRQLLSGVETLVVNALRWEKPHHSHMLVDDAIAFARSVGASQTFFMNPIISRAQYESLLATWPVMPHYDVDADRVKIPAGWLIEQCGWKGKSLGKAGVHSRQALVLVNRGGATGADIIHLSDTIRADVRTRFDIDIHPEVNIL